MTFDSDISKYNFYAQTTLNDNFSFGYGFVHSNKQIYSHVEFDLILPVFLTRTNDYFEYIDIKKSDTITTIPRQQLNPYFIDLGFFDGTITGELRKGDQLNIDAINYIKTRRVELSGYTNTEIKTWYESTGYYELPWNLNTNLKTTVQDIENINVVTSTIDGKAFFYDININR